MNTFIILFALFAASTAQYYGHETHHEEEHYSPPHYSYEYKVHDGHTGDVKSAHETREGDVVKGFYSFKEADGTTREVHYTSDKHNGFNAEVKRIGVPHYPEIKHHYSHDHHHY